MVLKQSHLQSPYHHPFIPPFPFPIIIGYTILLLDRSHHLAIHIIGLAPSSLFWPLGPIIPGFDHQRRHPPSLSAADPSTTICRIRTWSPSLVAVSISGFSVIISFISLEIICHCLFIRSVGLYSPQSAHGYCGQIKENIEAKYHGR